MCPPQVPFQIGSGVAPSVVYSQRVRALRQDAPELGNSKAKYTILLLTYSIKLKISTGLWNCSFNPGNLSIMLFYLSPCTIAF